MIFELGKTTITKIPELALEGVDPLGLFPGSDANEVSQAISTLGSDAVDHSSGTVKQSTHTWLVRTEDRVILIDTATGNDKEVPSIPVLEHLNEPFLDHLKRMSISPNEVTDVLITHIHADHVGWNTYLDNGTWKPTFRNATHHFSGLELDYNAALSAGNRPEIDRLLAGAALGMPLHPPAAGVYEASVVPILNAGLAKRLEVGGNEPIPGFQYIGTPGHSLDHASVMFEHAGEIALFWGDVMHHPLQLSNLEWNSLYCEFPEAARSARFKALEIAADSGALVFTTHFPASSVGRVKRTDSGYRWVPEQGKA